VCLCGGDGTDKMNRLSRSHGALCSIRQRVVLPVRYVIACCNTHASILSSSTLKSLLFLRSPALFTQPALPCWCVSTSWSRSTGPQCAIKITSHGNIVSSLSRYLVCLTCNLRFSSSTLCCCAVLCCAVLCCAVLCCAVLCCAVLCCAVLCCAVLYYAMLQMASHLCRTIILLYSST
jgi:hypothetical protein